jgi:hypothetical protein
MKPPRLRGLKPSAKEKPRLFEAGDDPARTLRVFISYSSKDSHWCEQIDEALAALKREELIETWRDRTLLAGSNWDPKIFAELESSDIVLLLISQSFINSDFCYGKEMKRALELQSEGHLAVVPISVRECDWGDAVFARLNSIPPRNRPLDSFPRATEGLTLVAAGLRRLVKVIRGVRAGEAEVPTELTIPVLTSAAAAAAGDDPAGILAAAAAGMAGADDDRKEPAGELYLVERSPVRSVDLANLCNRDDHAYSFEQALGQLQSPGRKRLLLGVVEGDEHQAHEAFADRLLYDVFPRAAPALAARGIHPFMIRWPGAVPSGSTPFEIFGPRLASALQLPPAAKLEQVNTALTRDRGVMVVRAGIYASDSAGSFAPLVRAWASLWHNWPEIPSGRLVVSLLLVKYSVPAGPELTGAKTPAAVVKEVCDTLTEQNYPRLAICRLAEPLGPISWQDILNWLNACEEVRQFCAAAGGTHRVERALRDLFERAGRVPMELVLDRLNDVLREFRKAS